MVKDNFDKGADLERRVGRVEFGDGSLVRLRWPVVQHTNRRRLITDVDVFTLDFDSRLRPSIGIIECKSTRGRAGEHDRLLWLAGLRVLVRASSARLVRDAVSPEGRDLARQLGVEVVASRELQRREESHGWLPYSFATVGNESYVSATREADAQFKTVGSIPADLISYIRHDSLISPPHRILGSILTLAEILREGVVLPQPAGMILAADTLVALLVSALRSARRLDQLGPDGMRREIEDGLATGNPHDRSIIRIVDLADRLLREQIATLQKKYASAGAQPVEHYTPSLREHVTFTPDWLTRFYDLSERLWHRPDLARELPQTVDLICYDALLGNTNWKSQAFSHLFSLEHRQLLIVAVDTLRAATPELASYLSGILDISFNMAPVPPRNVVRRNPLIKDSNEGDDGDGTQQELPV